MSLGIYFGPKMISIVEVKKGKGISNNIQISTSAFSVSVLDDRIPEEVKTVAVIKENLRKNQIEARETGITLSSKDLIIRTFGIPILPSNELHSAINFEAKKYIPFKIEELVSSYQVQLDKLSRRYYVLFVGIKKEILEKYFSILQQLNLKISSIEYSAFSILRLIDLIGLKEKGVIGVINIDVKEGDDAAFTVIENGFPLFTCDIKFSSGTQENSNPMKDDGMASEKFKTEIRISLDYYNHKFPGKRIKRMFLIGTSEYSAAIEAFVHELDLSFKLIDSSKIIGNSMPFSLSFLKGYSCALSNVVKTAVKVDILSAWEKAKQSTEILNNPIKIISAFFLGLKLNPIVLISAVLICIGSFVLGALQKAPLQRELNKIITVRPKAPNIDSQLSKDELQGIEAGYREQIITMEVIFKKQIYLTLQLSSISSLLPKGMWIESYRFTNNDGVPEFDIKGTVYLNNNSKELDAINTFLISLKKDSVFSKYFNSISVTSADTRNIGNKIATSFFITGRNP